MTTDHIANVRAASERRASALEAERQATAEQARALREAREAGVSFQALQEATGLTRQRIWQILSKRPD